MVNKKRRLICIVIIGIILLGLIVGFFIVENNDKQKEAKIKSELEQEFVLEDKTVEYGSEVNFYNEKEVSDENGSDKIVSKIYIGDEEITTYKFDKVGEVKFTQVNYAYYKTFFNNTKKVEVEKETTYIVEDTRNPIIEGVSDKTITVGDGIDLKDGIIARDEVDGKLEIAINGEVDTNTPGEYNINVIATDKNNNVTEISYKVIVNEKKETQIGKNETINSNNTDQGNTNKTTTSDSNNVNQSNTNKTTMGNSNNTKQENNNNNNTTEETSTYNYETYGNRIYFEEDRGENGNYGEKFTW